MIWGAKWKNGNSYVN
jgi:capsular polysaccharide biosynthesis protein